MGSVHYIGPSYFQVHELDSPDQPGSGVNMHPAFMQKLNDLRAVCGFPFIVTSGFRTKAYNDKIGGAKRSMHLFGKAVDILVRLGYRGPN